MQLLGRSRISLTLNAGYSSCALPIQLSNSPVAFGEIQKTKGYRPLFMRWARGVPFVLPFRSPKKIEGDGAPTRRMAWIAPDRPESFAAPGRARIAGPWGETSPPAPCSAPPSIFGLTPYQLPGPHRSYLSLPVCSERRPWAGLRPPFPQVPSRSPPSRRLMSAPLVEWIGIGCI